MVIVMKNLIFRIISSLFFCVSTQVFSADDNISGGGTGINDDLDCLEKCDSEYNKCENRTGGSFICNLQGVKCVIKCSVAIEAIGQGVDGINEIVTIQQKSTMRYLDAHEISTKDYRLVTRPRQNNKTQQWKITPLGNNTFTIRQESNKRFIDAHEHNKKDFGLVTRKNQNNNTQRWIMKKVGKNLFTLQQKSSGRYMDAHVTRNRDYEVVTRSSQKNNTQRWIIKPVYKINFPRIKRNIQNEYRVKHNMLNQKTAK